MEKILVDIASQSAGPAVVVSLGLFFIKGIVANAQAQLDKLTQAFAENTKEVRNLTVQMTKAETNLENLSSLPRRLEKVEVALAETIGQLKQR